MDIRSKCDVDVDVNVDMDADTDVGTPMDRDTYTDTDIDKAGHGRSLIQRKMFKNQQKKLSSGPN